MEIGSNILKSLKGSIGVAETQSQWHNWKGNETAWNIRKKEGKKEIKKERKEEREGGRKEGQKKEWTNKTNEKRREEMRWEEKN